MRTHTSRTLALFGLIGVTLVAPGCTAESNVDAVDAGGNGNGSAGGSANTGGGNGNGNTGGGTVITPVGGTQMPTGGTQTPTGGTQTPTGGTQGGGGDPVVPDPEYDLGFEPGFDAGEPLTPGDLDVKGDAELMSLVAAEEAACRTTCATYDTCGWLDAEADPPETVATCEADCTYAEEDYIYLTNATSREALAAALTSAEVLDRCIAALSCADMDHYWNEDVDPYPCEAEETAYYAAVDAAFPADPPQ